MFTRCLLAILLSLSTTMIGAQSIDVWFGTETPEGGESRGIYHARFNPGTGKLGEVTLAAEINSCGFLAIHPDGKTLYSTGPAANVSAFRIEGPAGSRTLSPLGSVTTGGDGAAHVSTSRDGRVLLSAQYGGGSTTLYKLATDGSIDRMVSVVKHADLIDPPGSGVVPGRQDAPHAHWTGTSPDDRFAFVPDLGLDRVVIFQINTAEPKLTHHGFGVCPPGGGPRHMRFSPDGKRIFVLNELALSVTVFDYDAQTGTMTPGQTIATLSEEAKAKELSNSAAEIVVHPSGRFVYSSNRGHDSITVFEVDQSGTLQLVEIEPIRGALPRNFNLDPTGNWLIAAGAESNSASVFSIDSSTGELKYVRSHVHVPRPICIVFAK